MDGYTFMIERNRRLIQHEVESRPAPTDPASRPDEPRAREALRRDLLSLYRSLEGCGREGEAPSRE